MCDEVAEQNADLGAQAAQQLKKAAVPFDERKTFAATKEDLEQKTADVLVVMQRQVPLIQKAQRTLDVPLLQYIDTTVDVPVAKQRREDTTGTARGLHEEVQRNRDGQEAAFRPVQDREQEADCLRQ